MLRVWIVRVGGGGGGGGGVGIVESGDGGAVVVGWGGRMAPMMERRPKDEDASLRKWNEESHKMVEERVAKKNTRRRPIMKFIDGVRGNQGVAEASKGAKMSVSGSFMVKEVCGSLMTFNLRGKDVEQISCHLKCVVLECGGNRRLCKEGPNDIIDRANFSFSFAILRRSVGARESK
ncbi:hypothetical protein E3N88_25637 [Mikania micrantha]|uniref:Uncharacterized protein n=1 Tax=Mikania micrantha TaxID=192012 RepID=A0A5N6N5B8_9ASTR|nr:hypothetical protein E3N88_25637 [Mikania micrantha]